MTFIPKSKTYTQRKYSPEPEFVIGVDFRHFGKDEKQQEVGYITLYPEWEALTTEQQEKMLRHVFLGFRPPKEGEEGCLLRGKK